MVFTKDDLAVIVTCIAENGRRTCLWRKAWTVCKPQRSQECYYIIRDKCHDANDQIMRKAILQWKKVFSSSDKAERRTYSTQLTNYCDILVWPDAFERRHEWWTTCKHCFMTFNAISFVSRLIQKCSYSPIITDIPSQSGRLSDDLGLPSFRPRYCPILPT